MAMKQAIYWGDFYLVEGPNGTDLVPLDVVGDIGLQPGYEMDIDDGSSLWVPAVNALMDYTENHGQITSIERRQGFYGRLTMPGYMDCTDWTWGDTEADVSETLTEMYGDDEGGDT